MSRSALLLARMLVIAFIAPALLLGQNQGGQLYRDPNGRFSVSVPNGWQLNAQNGGAVLVRGNASAVVTPFQGASSGRELVSMLASQYANQWRNLTPVNQGEFQLGGQPGAYATYSGVSPRGVNSVLRLSGIASRGDGFAFIISAPNAEFNQASPDFQAIEGSFSIGGAGNSGGNGGNNRGGGGFNPDPNGGNGGNFPQPAPGAVVLGVQSRDLEQGDLQQLRLRDMRGTLIAAVQPGSAADLAGVKPGDVVVSVDRNPVERTTDLRQQVATHRPGDKITLGVIRDGQQGSIVVALGGGDPNGGNGNNGGNGGSGGSGGNGGNGGNGNDPNVQPQGGDSTTAAQQQDQGSGGLAALMQSPGALLVVLVLVALVVWRMFRKP